MTSSKPKSEMRSVLLNEIRLGTNTRTLVRDEDYYELALDIRKNGLLENLIVQRTPEGSDKPYELKAGFRRWHACQAQEFTFRGVHHKLEVEEPVWALCLDRSVDPIKGFAVNFAENSKQKQLTAYETAS